MARKKISIWLFSTLTFVALLHLIDAFSVVVFDSQIKLFQLYPIINEKLQAVTPTTYFWVSAIATFILWGITCAVAFENPVETFRARDVKAQGAVESQLLEEKSEILDVMNETVIMNNMLISQVKDIIYNVRTEVKEIQPLKENIEKLKTELARLKRETRKFEEIIKHPNTCPTCRKPIMPEFKVCPFCGENTTLLPETIITLKDYK